MYLVWDWINGDESGHFAKFFGLSFKNWENSFLPYKIMFYSFLILFTNNLKIYWRGRQTEVGSQSFFLCAMMHWVQILNNNSSLSCTEKRSNECQTSEIFISPVPCIRYESLFFFFYLICFHDSYYIVEVIVFSVFSNDCNFLRNQNEKNRWCWKYFILIYF